jgi:hypothetical protein
MWNSEMRGLGQRPVYSPGLTRRIEYIQQQADELFMLDDFLTRIRKDYVEMLSNAVGQTDIAYCQLMQQSCIRFVHDFMSGYQEPMNEVSLICRIQTEGQNFLTQLHQWRNMLIEEYARYDLTDWWSDLKEHQEAWTSLCVRLYEAKSLIGCAEPRQLVQLVGRIAFLTSILTGHADRFDISVDYDLLRTYEKQQDDAKGILCGIIRKLHEENVIKKMGDWGLLMTAMNQTDGLSCFDTPSSFVAYLTDSPQLDGIELPSESSVSKMVRKMRGMFPDWTFTDTTDTMEINRRINVGKRLVSAARAAKLI